MGRDESSSSMRAYQRRKFYRGKKLTVIGAMTQEEVLTTKIMEKSMKGDDFLEYDPKSCKIKTLQIRFVILIAL